MGGLTVEHLSGAELRELLRLRPAPSPRDCLGARWRTRARALQAALDADREAFRLYIAAFEAFAQPGLSVEERGAWAQEALRLKGLSETAERRSHRLRAAERRAWEALKAAQTAPERRHNA